MLGGLDFEGLFLIQVSEVGIWLMPEESIVVEVDLSIQSVELAVLGQEKGIDFEQRRIKINIRPVEREHERRGFVNHLVGQTDSKGELPGLEPEQPTAGINGFFENLGRIGRSYFFDFHAARRRRHKHQSGNRAVENYTEVEFLLYPQAFFNQKAPDLVAFGAGLMGHQVFA